MKITQLHRYTVGLNEDDLVRLLDGPAPVTKCTSTQSMAPVRFSAVWERKDDGPWEFFEAHTSGLRVLASGALGQEIKTREFYTYTRDRWPDWVKVLVGTLAPVDQGGTDS
jgi:hypothetical protein